MKALKALKAPKEESIPREDNVEKTSADLEQELVEKIDASFLDRNEKKIKKVGGFHPS